MKTTDQSKEAPLIGVVWLAVVEAFKAIGQRNPPKFDFVDSPTDGSSERALEIQDAAWLQIEAGLIEQRSIGRNRKVPGWTLYRVESYPGSRDEPPDADIVFVGSFTDMNRLVAQVLTQIIEARMEDYFTSKAEEAQAAMEQEQYAKNQ